MAADVKEMASSGGVMASSRRGRIGAASSGGATASGGVVEAALNRGGVGAAPGRRHRMERRCRVASSGRGRAGAASSVGATASGGVVGWSDGVGWRRRGGAEPGRRRRGEAEPGRRRRGGAESGRRRRGEAKPRRHWGSSDGVRIRSIESLEPFRSIQRKQISLVDNDDAKIKFLLWGEQVLVANLLSVGSMLALDRPFIANIVDSDNEASQELCLEYGSATQIYLVPVIQHEEQVILTSTQMRSQGSRLLRVSNESQGLNASQVTLPRDSLGSIDFSKYPFRTYVIDLRDKMTGVSLYVTVTNICRHEKMLDTVFCVAIEDLTGVAVAKLHFVESWSLGRVGVGHTVYISGLTCSMTSEKLLEVSWFEKESGTSLVNLSCLPALLTSSCLQKIVYLSDVSNLTNTTHICHVHIEQIEHHNVQLLHVPCGCFAKERSDGLVECSFCQCDCNSRCMYSFQLHVTIADESGKVLAWCIGQTAAELLQISPDEFLVLPEDEQAMYLYSLQNEKFKVSLVNSKRHSVGSLASSQENLPEWEITRAQKCE
ncbi:uncharacterized protein [Typha angustifolia]|uniref:uncharacterized protein isoform X4 n=1 Tax=Typha angustifolia TaxID=59011 RepID=UPI003C2C9007